MKGERIIKTHVSEIGAHTNSGEALILETKFVYNGDEKPFIRQELTLHSYCNYACFRLNTAIMTPDGLRKLADKIEEAQKEADMTVNLIRELEKAQHDPEWRVLI